MSRSRVNLLELLAHPITQDAVRSLAQGSDPRGVLAGMAGDLFAQEVAKVIGARKVERRAVAGKASKAPSRPARAKVERMGENEVIDAEYTVIDVTPRGAKKAG